jgi:hypothetical protein
LVVFVFVLCTHCCQVLWIVLVVFFFVLCTHCCQVMGTQDEDKHNQNNPEKLTTMGT